jgi:hypothetical protein
MARVKKNISVTVLLFALAVVCATYMFGAPSSRGEHAGVQLLNDGAQFSEPWGEAARRRGLESHYEAGRFPVDCCLAAAETRDIFMISSGSLRDTDRKMSKEATIVSFAMRRHARKAYETEYLRSVTEGGKNVKIAASNISDWQKALVNSTHPL